ncbi:MAG: hypothetical protein, partial [Olavius algarvensis Gamma 1 endosymbiont]
ADSSRLEGGAPRGRPPRVASLCRVLPGNTPHRLENRIMSFAYVYWLCIRGGFRRQM